MSIELEQRQLRPTVSRNGGVFWNGEYWGNNRSKANGKWLWRRRCHFPTGARRLVVGLVLHCCCFSHPFVKVWSGILDRKPDSRGGWRSCRRPAMYILFISILTTTNAALVPVRTAPSHSTPFVFLLLQSAVCYLLRIPE